SSPPSLVTLGYPRETSQEAEMQLDTDLRARFAKVIDSAREAEESQARAAKPAGTPRRPYVTQGRIKLIRDMLFERFDAAEAQRRFDYFEWEKMSKARFDEIYTWLRQVPRIDGQADRKSTRLNS